MARPNRSCKDKPRIPSWRQIRAVYERRRRALRQAVLEPILVGWPVLRQVFTNALAARGHLVLCELGDVRFFVDPGDRVVGAWVMWHGGWQRREMDAAVEVLAQAGRLRTGAVFVDVGAHIGTHTVYALRSGRFARAIAFEPEPRNARLLAMNLEVNALSDAATVVPKAAGASAGKTVLHLHPRNTGAHSIAGPPSLDGQVALQVETVRLDAELECLGIAPSDIGLIWIDAEGYEPQVLEGLGELLARSIPLAFEFTPARYSAQVQQQLVARLASHYSTFQSLGLHEAAGPISALASRDRTDDVLVY